MIVPNCDYGENGIMLNIGTTGEGRPIYAIRISDNPNTDEPEPAILFTAMHHAREPMSPHILVYTMQELAAHYGTDSVITNLVNEREIWFIPMVNPDGYAFNEATSPSGGGLWRKRRLLDVETGQLILGQELESVTI